MSDLETELDDMLRQENEDLKARLAKLELALLDKVEATTKPRGPLPRYRLIKPFYHNDRYYDPEEGDEVIDWAGPPNDGMEPVNEEAHERMRLWMAGLPGEGNLSMEYIVEAAANLRPKHGEEEKPLAEFAGEIMRLAIEKRNKAEGRVKPSYEVSMPHKPDNVPVMGRKTETAPADDIAIVPQAPKPKRGQGGKRVFGAGVTETAIEIG